MVQLTVKQYDAVEAAIRNGTRIAVRRRGMEVVVVPDRLVIRSRREAIEARHPTTGEPMVIWLVEAESIETRPRFLEQRPRAGEIAVGQMLIAHRGLDQSLKRLAIGAERVAPVRLEQLVDLKIEMGVEERPRRGESLGARADGSGLPIGECRGRTLGPVAHETQVVALVLRKLG